MATSEVVHRPALLVRTMSEASDCMGPSTTRAEAGEDWRLPFRRLLGSVNMFDLTNDSILIQDFASGTESVADTYSVDGELGLVAVVRYSKSAQGNHIGVHDADNYLLPEDPLVRVLESYTRRVAEAVGIRTGCAHTEIMLTDRGPRLIEIAARLDGGCTQQATRLATGDSQSARAWSRLPSCPASA